MKKTLLAFLISLTTLIGCESPIEDTGGEELRASMSYQYCDYFDCPVCTKDPLVHRKYNIQYCPNLIEVDLSGWACCTDDLELCAFVGIVVDDTCTGMYLWCDYGENNSAGEFECWDEFGQG